MVYETISTKLGRKKIPNYFPLNNKTGPVLFNCSDQLEGKNIKSNINTAPQTSHIFQGLKEPPTLPLAPEPIGTKISQQVAFMNELLKACHKTCHSLRCATLLSNLPLKALKFSKKCVFKCSCCLPQERKIHSCTSFATA